MKAKVMFIIAVLIYVTFSLVGVLDDDYKVRGSGQILKWPLYISAFLLGTVWTIFYIKLLPEDYRRQNMIAQMFIPIVFIVFSFGFNVGYMRFINSLFNKGSLTIKGIIENRYYTVGKGTSYYMTVRDTITNITYELSVSKNAYHLLQDSRIFNKEFKIGYFGIIYRNKP